MISLQTLAAAPLQSPRAASRDPLSRPARDEASGGVLPSLTRMRDSQRSQAKDMAARKVQAIRERMNALKLMVKLDPRAALKMTAGFAKELRAAVKEFVDAGGRNPTSGEMKMAMRDAEMARDAADRAEGDVPAEPAAAGSEVPVDAETKRAQAAYAAAAGVAEDTDRVADRLEAKIGLGMADMGFFEQVKQALGDIKSAREKIKADWAHPRSPSKDDWKAADKELTELEREIDLASTGLPEPREEAPASVSA